jgi:phage regulator Rha-like protein
MKETTMMTTMSGMMDAEQRMTSLTIAQVTGKMHKDVLKAIRNMEPAWLKVNGRHFELVEYKDSKGEFRPCYSLTKAECLYIATKFSDEARARLVKRWYQLEREQLGVKMEEQKLLVTKREIMLKSDEIRRGLIAGENADADGCYTVSQLAEMMEITVKELNKRLVAEGVQFRNGGRYMLTKEYEGRGYAQDRSFHYYGLDGEKKEKKYLVWTPAGREFVSAIFHLYFT